MKTAIFVLITVMAPLFFGGCISSKPTTTYLLRADEQASRQYANAVIIDGVHLAGYLDRSNPVKRSGRHKLDIYPSMVWAQDFRTMIKETLSTNVMLRNSHSADAKVFRALVSFLRFEVDENSGKLVVSVVCSMKCGKENIRKHFAYDYDCNGCSGDRLIDAYDKALSELADKLCEMADNNQKQ